jgi:hypothetical protein
MPRGKTGPSVPWPSLEQCTPLGTLLVEWMWAQRPPMPVALLASRVGVDRSTLFSWLTTERQPQPMQLLVLAQATELGADSLAQAAGAPLARVAQTELLAGNDLANLTPRLREVRDAPQWQPRASAPHWRDAEGADVTRMADATSMDATTDVVGKR